MELKIRIKDKEELQKLNDFVRDNSIEVIKDKKHSNGKKSEIDSLLEYLDTIKIEFPEGYKFNRDEANER